MAYIDHIRAFQQYDITQFTPFIVKETSVGWIRSADIVPMLKDHDSVFTVTDKAVILNDSLDDFESRSKAVHDAILKLIDQGRFPPLPDPIKNEVYPVGPSRTRPLLTILRAYSHHFGIVAYGCHANCITPDGDLWITRRAKDKGTYPGMLDQMVAGGLPYGQSPKEGIIREGDEEAGVPMDYTSKHIQAVGLMSYARESRYGLESEVIYLYDMMMPQGFKPHAKDGEVHEFMTVSVDELIRLTRDTKEFKDNCNLVNIDYLIRHGFITPDNEPDYDDLCNGLRFDARRLWR